MDKVTIRDIAESVGVSVSTVSRIINGKGKYSDSTRKAVLNAIHETQYTPNLVARTLRSNQSRLIGIMVPHMGSVHFSAISEMLVQELIKRGYTPLVCVTLDDEAIADTYFSALSLYNAAAIVHVFREIPVPAAFSSIPTVYLGTVPDGVKGCPRVLYDIVGGARSATNELIRSGARRIVYIQSDRMRSGHIGRYLGYQQALWENGIHLDEGLCLTISKEQGRTVQAVLEELLNRGASFDGVYANSLTSAIETISYLKSRGLCVPDDVRVITLDSGPLAEMYAPSISTIEGETRMACDAVVNAVQELLETGAVRAMSTCIPTTLHLRETTGAIGKTGGNRI